MKAPRVEGKIFLFQARGLSKTVEKSCLIFQCIDISAYYYLNTHTHTQRLHLKINNTATMAEEATINPDGTQSFPNPTASDAGTEDEGIPEDIPEETIIDNDSSTGGIDPAIYLALAAVVFAILFIVMRRRRKRATADVDDFFSNLDGEKVSFFFIAVTALLSLR